MKKAMLFVVALLFSVSVNAATLSLTEVGSTIASQSADVTSGSVVLGSGTVSTGGTWSSEFALTTDEDTPVVIAWSFNPAIIGATLVFGTLGDTVSYAITEDFSFTAMLTAGADYILSIIDATSSVVKYDVSVSAVPVPAALFLFAPALLGFLGMRRKAAVAA
ncbi:hypothetical protein [Methylophaga sulfidovorans]|uniref:VPLPA-CTERM protein sorting domain-containing protein n=1 Tax=Methylophaga sulfidovorans TaxID=45496 RepID=A0A1I3XLM0_9GAMM|nr:hypothetical protein [Methylophaga sulfidovorans]SFK20517.1 hypothetical protein SAMN04488079_106144 [Methylophaga sulfidovorans]